MGKVIVEQIVSADAYAEDADGGIGFFTNANWINAADTEQLRMLSGVAAIVLGAKTYRLFAAYWPSADPATEPVAVPISKLPKFVVSSTLESAPGEKTIRLKFSEATPWPRFTDCAADSPAI